MARLSGLIGFSFLAILALPAQALSPRLVPRLLVQAPPSFALPSSLPQGTQIRIDGSTGLREITQTLAQQFEARYPGTEVMLSVNGSEAALQALRVGQIELAAIGRPLTADETAQGLVAVPVSVDKIAIIIGPDNPFEGTLTVHQFAQIFRGEITDWSQLGGAPAPLRFVDRPATSDLRQSFQNYPVFQEAPFQPGSTAEPVAVDGTQAVIEALGRDGIGFAIASQVLDNPTVKILPMHQTLPDDPRYPFSQVRSYVYQGEPSPAVQAYLGFATSAEGQVTVAEAQATTSAMSPESEAVASEATAAPGVTATSPDGQIMAQAMNPGEVQLTARDGTPLVTMTDLSGAATALAFSPDNQILAVGLANGTVQYWSVEGQALGEPFAIAPEGNFDLAFTEDGTALSVQTPDGISQVDLQGRPWVESSERHGVPVWGWLLSLGLLGLLLWMFRRGRENPLHDVVEPVPFDPEELTSEDTLAKTVGAGPFLEAAPRESGEQGADDEGESDDDEDEENQVDDGIPDSRLDLMLSEADQAMAADLVDQMALMVVPNPGVVRTAVAYTGDRPHRSTRSPQPLPWTSRMTSPGALPRESGRQVPLPEAVTDQNKDGNVNLPTVALAGGAFPGDGVAVIAQSQSYNTAGVAQAIPTVRIIPPLESPMTDPLDPIDEQSLVEATKYETGGEELDMAALASVDEGLADLPDGYGESRIVLMPRDPRWVYAYWDVPNSHREELRNQGGQQLALRLYDVTDIDLSAQAPHSLQQYDCDEMARTWYLPVPVSDRDYVIEIGYLTLDDRWLVLARSAPVHIPPVYPSDWIDDRFLAINWDEDLRGKTFATLKRPGTEVAEPAGGHPIHDAIFAQLKDADAMRVAGSLFGSMQQVPEQAISSYVFPSGVGMWALPTVSGVPTVSGLTMSGIGFSASVPPIRPRKFWLVADAELIVYGATEPDATVTIGGRVIPLNPDGTFRFHLSFQDGVIDYPIVAVAADGEQTRSIHMTFERNTPERNTNTRDEARDEWFED
jgi:ABC-type phosphate transport system substrate-binding protein